MLEPLEDSPLTGYTYPRRIIYASKDNTIQIKEYDLSLPILESYSDEVTIKKGKNIVNLRSYSGILFLSLKKEIKMEKHGLS